MDVWKLAFLNNKINNVFDGYQEKVSSPVGASRELDTTVANVFNLTTFEEETTITFKTPASGTNLYSMTVIITQGVTPQTINLPVINWAGGTPPTLTGVGTTYILTFATLNNGTNWYGMNGGAFT